MGQFPKDCENGQNWHFWSIWARPCRLFRCPVGESVGGCGARAVSRKTPIYFIVQFSSGMGTFVLWAMLCRLIRYPVGGLVGGCGAQAVSRKTPIYFISVHCTEQFIK